MKLFVWWRVEIEIKNLPFQITRSTTKTPLIPMYGSVYLIQFKFEIGLRKVVLQHYKAFLLFVSSLNYSTWHPQNSLHLTSNNLLSVFILCTKTKKRISCMFCMSLWVCLPYHLGIFDLGCHTTPLTAEMTSSHSSYTPDIYTYR